MYVTLTSFIPLPYNFRVSITTSLSELTSRARPYYDKNVRPYYDKHVRSRYDKYALSDYNKVAEPEQTQSNMPATGPKINFAIRATQALFAIVVFGISCSLIKGHKHGSLPSTLGFVAFIGGVSFVASLLGAASHWIQILQGNLGMLVDAAMVGLNVAGGIVRHLFLYPFFLFPRLLSLLVYERGDSQANGSSLWRSK